jgi:hypothetical protein
MLACFSAVTGELGAADAERIPADRGGCSGAGNKAAAMRAWALRTFS